jgi:hypothetical protein
MTPVFKRRQRLVPQRHIARGVALKARAHQVPAVRREEKDGKLYVTVQFLRPWWQRALGAHDHCERTFGLDTYGRRVYECCNGKRTVDHIVRRFARETHISVPEAETAVTTFMKTLIAKGLVAMVVARN